MTTFVTEQKVPRTVAAALLKLDAMGGVADAWFKFAMLDTGRPGRRYNAFRHVKRFLVDLNAAKRAASPDVVIPALWALNDEGRDVVRALRRGNAE